MSIYKQRGSNVIWYEFQFAGRRIRESAKTTSKTVAREAMRARRRQLVESYNGIPKKPERPKTFSVAAEEYIALRRSELAPRTMEVIERSVKQLLPFVGKKPLSEITPLDIRQIVEARLAKGLANRYVNMTIETLRTILRWNHQWERLRPFYKKLKEPKNIGKELSHEAEKRLLIECRKSVSRGLTLKVILGMYGGMRKDEIRPLQWHQIDINEAYLTVGKSKTEHGEGRIIPLIAPALEEMKKWGARFPNRLPEHYVFPAEKYSIGPAAKVARVYSFNPNKPMGSCKRAWNTARKRAGVHIRFHDLRHTTVSRLLEEGRTLEQIAPILGWSATTMAEMMIRYQHRNLEQKRQTMSVLEAPKKRPRKSKRPAAGA